MINTLRDEYSNKLIEKVVFHFVSFHKYIIIKSATLRPVKYDLKENALHTLMLCCESYLRQSVPLIQSNITENLNLNNFQLQSYIFQ